MALKQRSRLLKVAWITVAIGALITALYITFGPNDNPAENADIGPLFETANSLPSSIAPPALGDATERWGLGEQSLASASDLMASGVALADLDGDGDLDLAAAHDAVAVYLWEGERFGSPLVVGPTEARAVSIADVDADGRQDLLIAQSGDSDTIVWGGGWIEDNTATPETTELRTSGSSAGLLAAELSGDATTDIVALSRGNESGEVETLWVGDPNDPREFHSESLGGDPRLSLAGEVTDVDSDGLLDVWITRDLGWDAGGDSVFSRRGDPTGSWTDIADELGVALEVDGMGLTIADLNDDLFLDAYVSDLGSNEVLIRSGDNFVAASSTGAARIRPPGAEPKIVSSSWATGTTDLNLDGRLDLVVANGGFADGDMLNKIPDTEVAQADPPGLLIGIGGGQFVEAWPAVNLSWASASRGMAIGDVDRDGDDDLVFIAADGTFTSLENLATGPSISIVVESGCSAAGAIVTVTQGNITFQAPLLRHTYGGQHSATLTVGRISADSLVEVKWLDGTTFSESLAANHSGAVQAPCPGPNE